MSTVIRTRGADVIAPHPECAWCSKPVLPIAPNVTGGGYTYPHDEDGDIACASCIALPNVRMSKGGDA